MPTRDPGLRASKENIKLSARPLKSATRKMPRTPSRKKLTSTLESSPSMGIKSERKAEPKAP